MNLLRQTLAPILARRSSIMATNPKTSLSVDGPKPADHAPKAAADYDRKVTRPPHLDRLRRDSKEVERLDIQVEDSADGYVPAFLHMPPDFVSPAPQTHHRTAAILLSGAGGGVVGPSSIYLSLAAKLSSIGTGIPAIRLDYRYPARMRYCMPDVKAAMDYLSDMYALDRFVLVGWSFGGAPVFTMAAEDERVVGCATVASQTAETSGIRRLAPRPVLLLHGTGDRILSYDCSKKLYEMYGTKGSREIKLFEGDNHALSGNVTTAEKMLLGFIVQCAGLRASSEEREAVAGRQLVEEEERTELMKKGGDLRSPESVQ